MTKYKLSDVCRVNPKDELEDLNIEVSFIPMQSVSEHGDIDVSEIRKASEVSKGYTSFIDDDVLMAKITPCMENGKGAVARDLRNGRGFGSTEFYVLRPDQSVLRSQWVYYATTHKRFRLDCERNMTGTAGQKRVPKTYLEQCEIEVPPLDVQDEVLGQLNILRKVIGLRQQQNRYLDELIKARFVEMFGSEDQIDGWPCCAIEDIADVNVGVVIKPAQYYAEKGIPAFRSLNIGEMYVKDSEWVYFTEEGHLKNQKSIVRENDVLVVRSGAPGTACVATKKYDGYNAIDIIIAHPNNATIDSTFLAAYTNMPHGMNQIRQRTGGAAQQHFNVGGYKSLRIIVPPIETQRQFASFVAQVDKSKSAVQKGLDEAQMLFDSLMQQYFG